MNRYPKFKVGREVYVPWMHTFGWIIQIDDMGDSYQYVVKFNQTTNPYVLSRPMTCEGYDLIGMKAYGNLNGSQI